MSKVSIGEDEYETADLLAYQQFSLWLYELVLGSVDGVDEEVVEGLEGSLATLERDPASCGVSSAWG